MTSPVERITSTATVGGSSVDAVVVWEVESESDDRVVYLGTGAYPGLGLSLRARLDIRDTGEHLLTHTLIWTESDAVIDRLTVTCGGASQVLVRQAVDTSVDGDVATLITRRIDWQPSTLLSQVPEDWADQLDPAIRAEREALVVDAAGMAMTHDLAYSLEGSAQWIEPNRPALDAHSTPSWSRAGLMPLAADCGDLEELFDAWLTEYRVPLGHPDVASAYDHPTLEGWHVPEKHTLTESGIWPNWKRWWGASYGRLWWLILHWWRTGDATVLTECREQVRLITDQVIQDADATNAQRGTVRSCIGNMPTAAPTPSPHGGHGSFLALSLLLWYRITGDRRVADALTNLHHHALWWLGYANTNYEAGTDEWLRVLTWKDPAAWAIHCAALNGFSSSPELVSTAQSALERLFDPEEPHGLGESVWFALDAPEYRTATYKIDATITTLWQLHRMGWDTKDAAISASRWAKSNTYVGGTSDPVGYQSHRGWWLAELYRETGEGLPEIQALLAAAATVLSDYNALNENEKGAALFATSGRPDNGWPAIPGSGLTPETWALSSVALSLPAAACIEG